MADLTKILNTRLQLKYDTYANWKSNNPKLLKGEIAIATIDTNEDGVQNAPSILIKVGDGVHQYTDLKFISGEAADVYGWAKAATKPSYKADEIGELSDFIAKEIQDTDTQYKIEQDTTDGHILHFYSKAKDAEEWSKVTSITTVDTVYNDTEVRNLISAVSTLVGNTSVSAQIEAAIEELDLANTYEAKGEAAKVQGTLDTHMQDTAIHVTTDDKASWSDKYTKSEIDGKVGTIEEALADRYTKSEVDGQIDTIEEALADRYTKSEIDGQIDTIEEALADRYTKTETQELINSAGHLKRDIVESLPAAESADADTIYMLKVGTSEAGDNYEEYMLIDGAVVKIGDTSVDLTPYATKDHVEERGEFWSNSAVDSAKDYTDETLSTTLEDYATKTYADGILEDANDYTDNAINSLAAIAKTGSTDDLVQGTKVLIFSCGDSNCEDISL